jgi:hypothetical protein
MSDNQPAITGQSTAASAAIAGMSTCGSLKSDDDDELVPPQAVVGQKTADKSSASGVGSPPPMPTTQSAPVPLERENSTVMTPFTPLPVSQLTPRAALQPELQRVVDAAIAMASKHLPANGNVPNDSYVAVVLTPHLSTKDTRRIPSLAQGPSATEHKRTCRSVCFPLWSLVSSHDIV